MTVFTISRGDLHLAVAPSIGGSIAEFFQMRDGQRRDILRPAHAAAFTKNDAREMASFPLLPFCNRIRDSTFSFEDQLIRLVANLPPSAHAIHGIGWQVPWQVIAHTADTIVLALDYGQPAQRQQFGWPWAFYAEQEFHLNAQGLQVKLRLQNRSTSAMPFGIGHHPYFPKTKESSLQTELSAMWLTDAEVLPLRLQATPLFKQLARGVRVDQHVMDNNFTGWNRDVRIQLDARHPSIRLQADAGMGFLGIYVPSAENYFCVEPVSMCTDAFNLIKTHTSEQCGAQTLLAGASFETRWSLLV
ncbi:aldose 1-epimerase [Undibacterium flavidum]|uniref:Aldose 1-epimerase n=1 Tax=Undibacterium flavidum TaxID=2762297 RepID=A0ABR6Y7A5_9BURK|nr:aldose 1-epimerase [Undibacterium flavidum]MBC3872503.1 aldose 1-epimerase [Undibacterium flavidum]